MGAEPAPAPDPPAPPEVATRVMVCLSIVIMDKIQFAPAAVAPLPESRAVLDAAVSVLRDHPEIRVVVEGHHDDSEADVARRRAEAVRDHFIAEGIAPDRLCAASYGQDHPLVDGTRPEDRAKNRRVELRVLPEGESCPE